MTEAQAAHVETLSDTAAPENAPSAEELSLVQPLADESMDWDEMWAQQDAEEKAQQDRANGEEGQGGDELNTGQDNEGTGDQGAEEGTDTDTGNDQNEDLDAADKTRDGQDKQPDPSADTGSQEIDWSQVSPEHRAAFERAQRNANANAKRVNAFQRRYEDAKGELDRIKSTPAQHSHQIDPKATFEALDKVAEELPEVAGPIRDALALVLGKVDTLETVEGNRQAEAATKFDDKVFDEVAKMEASYPGWQNFIADREADFLEWVDDQPRATREFVAKNAADFQDADGFVPIYEKYRSHLGLPPSTKPDTPSPASQGGSSAPGQSTPENQTQPQSRKRERQKDASTAVPRSSSPGSMNTLPSGSGSWDDTWEEWDRYDAIHGTSD